MPPEHALMQEIAAQNLASVIQVGEELFDFNCHELKLVKEAGISVACWLYDKGYYNLTDNWEDNMRWYYSHRSEIINTVDQIVYSNQSISSIRKYYKTPKLVINKL